MEKYAMKLKFNIAKKRYEIAEKNLRTLIEWWKKRATEEEKQKIDNLDDYVISTGMYVNMILNDNNSIPKREYFDNIDIPKKDLQREVHEDESFDTYDSIMDIYHEYVISLNELKKIDDELEYSRKDEVNSDFLNEKPRGKLKETVDYDTSVLDNYRNWGISRICLDGFQNHLPEDSKGTGCFLQFYIDNKWVGYKEAAVQKDKITKIRFADDGVGFDSRNLKFLSSQKSSEDLSAGQFGEGLKLIAMASVNLGLDMEVQSKNWIAKAYGKKQNIYNYRNDGVENEEQHNQLAWQVSTFEGEPIIGSRTIFNNPTPELIDYALKLPEYILEISSKEVIDIDRTGDSQIVDLENGGLSYCKGIYVKDINSFFSYNFKNEKLNPDRNDFVLSRWSSMDEKISWRLSHIQNYEVIKQILRKVIEYYANRNILTKEDEVDTEKKDFYEKHPLECKMADNLKKKFEEKNKVDNVYCAYLWKKAFYEIYKEQIKESGAQGVVLRTNYKAPKFLEETLKRYKIVSLPTEWTKALSVAGVKTDKQVIPDFIEEKIQTSLTLDYGAELWDTQRIVLDACQNHLPADAGGNNIFLRFQTIDGKWHDYRDFEKFQDNEIKKIKICDDGRGYDYKSLGLFASIKGHEESTGKWGEGLKMIAASAVRNGIKMELRSRDWLAIPYTEKEIINEGKENQKQVDRLNFNVKIESKENGKTLDDGDNIKKDENGKELEDINNYGYSKDIESSSTTFIDPTLELIHQFRDIKKNVLLFNSDKPMTSLDGIDVLNMFEGNLYVKNILVPGNHQLKYSYHLKNFDIETRDRDAIKKDSMQVQLMKVLENIEDERFIKIFLMEAEKYAKNRKDKSFLEFETYFNVASYTDRADLWIKAFQEYFGKDACVREMSSQNYTEVAQAEHMGLETITLPDSIASMLTRLEGKDGQKIQSYKEALNEAIENSIPVDNSELNSEELAIIDQLYKYNSVLKMSKDTVNEIKQINIYDYEQDYKGKRAAGYAGYGETVYICRDTLRQGLLRATDVFLHEVGHAETGAEDSAPGFRNYQTGLSASIITAIFPLEKSVIDNGLAKNIRFPRFKNFCKKIFFKIIGVLDEDKNKGKNTIEKEVGE